MTDVEFRNLKATLEAKRLELAAQLSGQIRELTIEAAQPELLDWVQSMNDRDQTAGMISRFSSTLAAVDRSLRAIAEDSYGECMRCQHPISVRRLQSIPWAAYCVRCQEQVEAAGEECSAPGFDEPAGSSMHEVPTLVGR